jgi:hypothetical protein
MSVELERDVRTYATYLDEVLPTITADEIRFGTHHTSPNEPERQGLRPVLSIVVAAVLTTVLIGGIVWLAPFAGDTPPVDEIDVTTTTVFDADGESLLGFSLADMPPFRATVSYDRNPEGLVESELFYPGVPQGATAVVEVAYDTPDRFRREIVAANPAGLGEEEESPGSYLLANGGVAVEYMAGRDQLMTWEIAPSPLGSLFWNSDWPDWDGMCAAWTHEFLHDEMIAGRDARHLKCSDLTGDWEFWVDAETGVVLKMTGAVGRNAIEPGTSPGGGFEVTSINYGHSFTEDVFAMPESMPQGERTGPARWSQVPPLHATLKITVIARDLNMALQLDLVDDPSYTQEIWYAGAEGWRADFIDSDLPAHEAWVLDAGHFAGDSVVWTGSERYEYFGSTNTYMMLADYESWEPRALLNLSAPPSPDWLSRSCGSPIDDVSLGRASLRYACIDGAEQIDAWIDAATGLILKWAITGGPVSTYEDERPNLTFEFLSLELDPTFAPGTFEFAPPPDAVDVADIPFDKWSLFGFGQGDVVPTWTGSLVAGDDTFTLEDVQGRPALVLLWASWDDSGLTAISDFAALSEVWGTDVAFVSVGIWDEPEATRNVVNRGGFTFPTVSCLLDDGTGCSPEYISELWGFNGWLPVGWVLLDADGRVIDVFVAEYSLNEISAALIALTGSG